MNENPIYIQRNGTHPHAVFTHQQVHCCEEWLVPGDFIVTSLITPADLYHRCIENEPI